MVARSGSQSSLLINGLALIFSIKRYEGLNSHIPDNMDSQSAHQRKSIVSLDTSGPKVMLGPAPGRTQSFIEE